MKAFIAFLALVGVASAGFIGHAATLVRTPSLDSAVIKAERLGGNFAHSTVEGHSYAAVAPIVRHVATPVAVSYQAHAPVVTSYAAPAIASYATHGIASYAAPAIASYGAHGLLRSGLYSSHLAHPYSYAYGAYSTPHHTKVLIA